MTRPEKRDSPKPLSLSGPREHTAGLFEYVSVILAGVVITLRPILPGHPMACSRNLLLHALIAVAGFLWLAAQCLYGRIRIYRSGIGIPMILYTLVIGVSPLFAAYKFPALMSLPIWLTNLLLFFIVFNLSRDKRTRGFFIAVLLATAAVVIFQGLHQRLEGFEEMRQLAEQKGFLEQFHSATARELALARLKGNEPFASFTTSNILATFLLITVPVLFGAGAESLRNASKTSSILRAAFLLLAGGAGLACLYLTGSLAGYVVLAVEAGIFFLIFFKHWITRHWHVLAIAAGALALALAVFGPTAIGRICEVRSVNYRLGYWTGGWEIFRENWLTGVGLENFRWSYTAHKPPWAGEVAYPHNSIIQTATEFGVPGLVAFMAIWILFLVRILRARNRNDALQPHEGQQGELMKGRRLLLAGSVALIVLLGEMTWCQPFGRYGQIFSRGVMFAVLAALLWTLVFAVSAFHVASGKRSFIHVALATGSLGFLLHSAFDFSIYSYGVNQACWVTVALALATVGGGVRVAGGKPMSASTRLVLTLIGGGALLFYMLGPTAMAWREERAQAYAGKSRVGVSSRPAPDLAPQDTDTLRLLAWKYFHKYRELRRPGDKKDPRIAEIAIRLMREAIRLNPKDFALHIETAIILREIGRHPEALEEYNRAIDLYPTRPSLKVYRAELLAKMGRNDDARRDLEETARLLRLNRMPDGSVRHKTLELDVVRGLHDDAGSEQKMYDTLRERYQISDNS